MQVTGKRSFDYIWYKITTSKPALSKLINKINPSVSKPILKFLAGILWFGTGIMLTVMGAKWIIFSPDENVLYFGLAGLAASLIIHYFGFSKIVDKNLIRINQIKGKFCLFGFMRWQSYLTIFVMMTMGITLRHSSIPREWLSVVYVGIGTALVLSSMRYFRDIAKSWPSRKCEVTYHCNFHRAYL